jgi:hypothetical protein
MKAVRRDRAMGTERVQLKALPPDFREVLMREFVPYLVGLARVSKKRPLQFASLGSGTLVSRRGRVGILTADHCMRAVRTGKTAGDPIHLVLPNRSVELPAEIIFEHSLVNRANAEFGPDLAFIEIAACERLGAIKAIASVWPLDRDPTALLKEFGAVGSLLVSLGFPEERCRTEIEGNTFRRTSYHLACLHVIEKGNIIRSKGWDYVDSKCWYGDSNPLPKSFQGSSGGGIWGVKVHKNSSDGKLAIRASALAGVQFYQTPMRRNVRYVRGHFIRSIYETAWKKLDCML